MPEETPADTALLIQMVAAVLKYEHKAEHGIASNPDKEFCETCSLIQAAERLIARRQVTA